MALVGVTCPACSESDFIDPGDEPLEPWQEVRWECSHCRQVIVEQPAEIPQAEYAIAQAEAAEAHLAGLPEFPELADVLEITVGDVGEIKSVLG